MLSILVGENMSGTSDKKIFIDFKFSIVSSDIFSLKNEIFFIFFVLYILMLLLLLDVKFFGK